MRYDVYLRLVVLTAGTLLPFFWIVVILGHRRQRNFERIFFFLCLALVFFFGGSLLALNAKLYYLTRQQSLEQFAWTVVCIGVWMMPSLLAHLHAEYGEIRGLLGKQKWLWIAGAYVPAIVLLPRLWFAIRQRTGFDFGFPSTVLGKAFQVWLVLSLAISAVWQQKFLSIAPDKEQESFHRELKFNLGFVGFLLAGIHIALWHWPGLRGSVDFLTMFLTLAAIAPLIELLRNVQRFNFLQIGRQRNLLYAVFAAFVGLLYLSLIRRMSQWLEPYFPPEATAALLLFLPVVFFEPLQRLIGRVLRRTAQLEMDQANRTMMPIQEVARLGDMGKLRDFSQKWTAEQLQLAEARLFLDGEPETKLGDGEESFAIRKSGKTVGALRVRPYGAMLSGETAAALEYLCEQLPAVLDLCRLIEEKLKLERELAERERLAALGQMAASISHNLKNPLGSMKTILQVQLENPEMPESLRGETKMVLEEIGRLSTKLNQLLQFSRPAVIGEDKAAKCDAREIAREVVSVLRPEAQRKGVALELNAEAGAINVGVGKEALNDILTNLVVNALDAAPRGGHVQVCVVTKGGGALLSVQDDGPGVPVELQEKILQPFFTTKTQGTGLGLAIVARRAGEFGGKLECRSPLRDGRGTSFEVGFPTSDSMNQNNGDRS